jgi:hypothetical protein
MKPTTTRVTGLVALAVLISVTAVHGAGSKAALTKQDMASFARSESSQSAATMVTEAPTATAAESLQLLPNGDFEQGQAVWTVFSLVGWDIIMNGGFPGGVLPHGGSWLAWLGGADDEVSYIEQEVAVPTNTTALTFWYWLASQEGECGFDFGWLKVDGVLVEEYDLCTGTDTDTWLLREVDFSAYAGQTVTLRFQADTDADLNSNFFVDDVAFDISGIFSDGFESGDTSAWSSTTP